MRRLVAIAALMLIAAVGAACGGSDSSESAAADAPSDTGTAGAAAPAGACGSTLAELQASAEKEGKVNLIALPDTWANYKGNLESFRSKYKVEAPVANPDASSADEITAIKTLRGQPDMPDAVDVGPSFTKELIDGKLVDPFKPSTWDEIPDNLKDPDGNWIGAYYGVLAIASNTSLVAKPPKTWAELKDPQYKGQITLNGDPREAGAAFAGVVAAALANGGSYDDVMPGIEYFAELNALGNLKTADVNESNLLSGEVPIALDWTYNFPGLTAKLADAGFEMQANVPTDGVYGGFYALALVSEANHPCAARLWMEHAVGDDGALSYLKGGAIPARYAALQASGKITPELQATLPPADVIAKISFPTQAQTDAMKKVIADNWGPMVADK